MTFYVRTRAPKGLCRQFEMPCTGLTQNLPAEELHTMDNAMRRAMTRERLMSVMTGAFTILATLVAAIGLYGMFAYAVAQRTPEIGLRMALGATRAGVRWMILRQVLAVAIVGGAIGLASAMLLGRAAQALLFELQFHDPVELAGSIVALMLVAWRPDLCRRIARPASIRCPR
jgi:ABC-type antimicrobial peptide transport system permease subunit